MANVQRQGATHAPRLGNESNVPIGSAFGANSAGPKGQENRARNLRSPVPGDMASLAFNSSSARKLQLLEARLTPSHNALGSHASNSNEMFDMVSPQILQTARRSLGGADGASFSAAATGNAVSTSAAPTPASSSTATAKPTAPSSRKRKRKENKPVKYVKLKGFTKEEDKKIVGFAHSRSTLAGRCPFDCSFERAFARPRKTLLHYARSF